MNTYTRRLLNASACLLVFCAAAALEGANANHQLVRDQVQLILREYRKPITDVQLQMVFSLDREQDDLAVESSLNTVIGKQEFAAMSATEKQALRDQLKNSHQSPQITRVTYLKSGVKFRGDVIDQSRSFKDGEVIVEQMFNTIIQSGENWVIDHRAKQAVIDDDINWSENVFHQRIDQITEPLFSFKALVKILETFVVVSVSREDEHIFVADGWLAKDNKTSVTLRFNLGEVSDIKLRQLVVESDAARLRKVTVFDTAEWAAIGASGVVRPRYVAITTKSDKSPGDDSLIVGSNGFPKIRLTYEISEIQIGKSNVSDQFSFTVPEDYSIVRLSAGKTEIQSPGQRAAESAAQKKLEARYPADPRRIYYIIVGLAMVLMLFLLTRRIIGVKK